MATVPSTAPQPLAQGRRNRRRALGRRRRHRARVLVAGRHVRAEEPARRLRRTGAAARAGRGGARRERRPASSTSVVVDDREAAVAAIETREVYGAVILGAESPRCSPPPRRSPVVAQLLTGIAAQLQAQANAAAAAGRSGGRSAGTDDHRDGDGCRAARRDRPARRGPRRRHLPARARRNARRHRDHDRARRCLAPPRRALDLRRDRRLRRRGDPAGLVRRAAGRLPGRTPLAFTLAFAAIGAPIVGFAALVGTPGIAIGPVVFLLFANPISSAGAAARVPPRAVGRDRPVVPAGSRRDPHPRTVLLPGRRQAVPVARARGLGRGRRAAAAWSGTSARRAARPTRPSKRPRRPPSRRPSRPDPLVPLRPRLLSSARLDRHRLGVGQGTRVASAEVGAGAVEDRRRRAGRQPRTR